MGKIGVQHLKEGMVLAADLLAPNGRFILPRGAVLKEGQFPTLKAWGVVEADVEIPGEAGEGGEPEGLPHSLRERSRGLVDRYFPASRRTGLPMEELYRICVRRTAERMAQGLPLPGEEEGLVDPEFRGAALPRSKGGELSPRDLVQNDRFLASFPDVYFRITEVLNSPTSSVAHISEVVSKDPSLSAKLLKLVNSSFYGFASRIDSVSRAVVLIGGNELSTLALGISLLAAFKDVPEAYVTMRSFWMHSVSCGVFARLLSTRRDASKEEHFFLAGLLHDLGRLILYRRVPFSMAQALQEAIRRGVGVHQAERELLGFDHASVGYQLLKDWKIPPSLAEAVRFHHQPGAASDPYEPGVLHVADLLALGCRFGSSGSFVIPELDLDSWDLLGLSPNALDSLILQAERQIREVSGMFFG